jgi:hypothetical protein
MAIVYPLGLPAIWDRCKFLSYNWDIVRFEAAQQLQSGKIIATRKGKPKWAGSGHLRTEKIQDGVTLIAQLGMLKGSVGTFLAYDQQRPYPILDPNGAALSGFTPQVSAIHADNDQIRFKTLPSTYPLRTGDYFSINYGGGAYWYLGRLMSDATAVAGVTPFAYVEPDIPAGIAVNDVVNFIKPVCAMKLVIGGLKSPTAEGIRTDGIQLSWIQDY